MSSEQFDGYPGVAVSLLKGGVGKSTIALNVADRLNERGYDTVLIDLDKDGHMTTQLGFDDAYDREKDLGNALIEGEDPEDLLIETEFGVHFLPSNNEMENIETRLKDERFADVKLRREVVAPLIEGGYDYVVIDAAGGRGKLSDNALISVQRVIIPLIPSAGSINGLRKMMERQITPIDSNIGLNVTAVTPNMIRETMSQHNEHRTLVENLNRNFDRFIPEYARIETDVFGALDDPETSVEEIPKPGIRERTAISQAFKQGLPVSKFDEECDQISNFDHLADLVEESSHA
jgi:chromosome partitioning protein